MKPMRTPDRRALERIIAEEAEKFMAALSDVIGQSRRPQAIQARWSAVERALKETGCSECGLAKAWGMTPRSVQYIRRHRERAAGFDPETLAQLTWRYGPSRAASIAAGRDPQTNAGLTAWRNLGRRGAA